TRSAAVSKQFQDGLPDIVSRGWDVFETPAEGIVVTRGEIIDPESRIDRGGDIFGVDWPPRAPAGIFDKSAGRSGLADDSPALHAASRQERRMHKIVVAAILARDVADSPAEFAFCDDEGFIQEAVAVGPRQACQVGDQIGKAVIQGAGRRKDVGVDILVVVPSAVIDLYVADAQIAHKQITCGHARIAEARGAVTRL